MNVGADMISEESIIKRKSIRKYNMEPLSDEILQTLKDLIETMELPFDGKFAVRILTKEEYDKNSGGKFAAAAPYYLMFFGDKNDDNVLRNIGFAGEVAALKLAEFDIGTCWLGGPGSKETVDDSEYIICICFGRPTEGFRTKPDEAKRKRLDDIAVNYNAEQKELLDFVRLAPSAINIQPWFFRCEANRIHIFKTKSLNPMSKLGSVKIMQKIDIGIAISHFSLTPFTVENDPQNEKGMQYECTLKF